MMLQFRNVKSYLSVAIAASFISTMPISAAQASAISCLGQFTTRDEVKTQIDETRNRLFEEGKNPMAPHELSDLERYLDKEYYKTVESITDYSSSELYDEYDTDTKYHSIAEEASAAVVNALDNAKYSIDSTYYIQARDQVGYNFLGKIREAYKRGVNIRLMVDSSGSSNIFHGELKALLTEKGGQRIGSDGKPIFDANGKPVLSTIEVKVFNPMINMPKKLRRFTIATMKALYTLPSSIMARLNKLLGTEYSCETCENKAQYWNDKTGMIEPNFGWRNRRSHDKILLVDVEDPSGAKMFTGGRNMADAYYANAKDKNKNFHDMLIEFRPKAGASPKHLGHDAQDYYNKLWFHTANKNLASWAIALRLKYYEKQFKKMEEANNTYLADTSIVGKAMAAGNAVDANGVRGFDSGFATALNQVKNEIENISRRHAILTPEERMNRKNANSITKEIYDMIDRADLTIDLISPYYFVYPEQLKILQDWVAKDPRRKIRIFGNSVYSADNMADQSLTDHIVGPAIMKGYPYAEGTAIEVAPGHRGDMKPPFAVYDKWNTEWTNNGQITMHAMGAAPPEGSPLQEIGKLHEKVYIFDGKTVVVGTSNLDPRSMYENSEFGVKIHDQYNNNVHAVVLADAVKLFANSTIYGTKDWLRVRNDEMNKWKRIQCDKFWKIVRHPSILGLL